MSTQSESSPKSPNNASANLAAFDFDGLSLRSQVDDAGSPWFNANDVCDVLGFSNPRQALSTHVTDPDDVQNLDTIDTLGRVQQSNFVNESGLYALIFGSTKPEARRFKKWVTSEVLPSIRKTGTYTTPTGFNPLAHVDPTRVTYIGNKHDLTREGIYRAGCEVKLQGAKFVAKKYGVSIGFVDSIVRAGDRWLIGLEKRLDKSEGMEKLMADALKSACNASPTLKDNP